jgi:hypothetical protein
VSDDATYVDHAARPVPGAERGRPGGPRPLRRTSRGGGAQGAARGRRRRGPRRDPAPARRSRGVRTPYSPSRALLHVCFSSPWPPGGIWCAKCDAASREGSGARRWLGCLVSAPDRRRGIWRWGGWIRGR